MASERDQQSKRSQLAQEIIELGEELFELALELQDRAIGSKKATAELQELHAAKEDLFDTLRALLCLHSEGETQ